MFDYRSQEPSVSTLPQDGRTWPGNGEEVKATTRTFHFPSIEMTARGHLFDNKTKQRSVMPVFTVWFCLQS